MENNSLIIHESLNRNLKLYRYMTLGAFLELIELKRMYLTNLNYWEDPFEIPGKYKEDLGFQDNLLGQCWTLEGISDAVWKIYGKNKEGLLIESSVNKFFTLKGLGTSFLCPVIYYKNLEKALTNIENLPCPMKIFYHGLLKRAAFKHEQEVRLISYDAEENGKESKKNLLITVEPLNFIENIYIDPRASSWYVETIKTYCNRCNFNIIPKKSNLF